jgi:hypothetical protein
MNDAIDKSSQLLQLPTAILQPATPAACFHHDLPRQLHEPMSSLKTVLQIA